MENMDGEAAAGDEHLKGENNRDYHFDDISLYMSLSPCNFVL